MTYDYEYVREKLDNGAWDIDNPNRVDEGGNQIYLANEVSNVISKHFLLLCDGASAIFKFTEELTSGEEDTLDTVVSNHKNNT